MKAEVYPSPDGWRFRVRADNGEIMAVGESYVHRIDAEHALQTLFTNNRQVDVTIRNRGNEIVDHYAMVPPRPPETLDEAITAAEELELPVDEEGDES